GAVCCCDGVLHAYVFGDGPLELGDAGALGEPAGEDGLRGRVRLLLTQKRLRYRYRHRAAPTSSVAAVACHAMSLPRPSRRLVFASKPRRSRASSTEASRRETGFTLRTGSNSGCMPGWPVSSQSI